MKRCPICYLEDAIESPSDDEICPRCKTHFGYEDANRSWDDLRAEFIERQEKALREAREAFGAGIRYDALLQKAGEHPELVTAYGMVEGDDLDEAYEEWIMRCRAFLIAYPEVKRDNINDDWDDEGEWPRNVT